jgi:hypothetical protein
MALSRYVYYQDQCPECHQRACQTQTTEYSKSKKSQQFCPDAPDGAMKCLQTCCHGCECLVNDDCRHGLQAQQQCYCDCHRGPSTLRIHSDTFGTVFMDTATVTEQSPEKCQCNVCLHKAVVSMEYHGDGDDDSKGYWITNRPRHCLHFDDSTMVSTYYDNSDGRNHRLDDYFMRRSSNK